MYIAQCFAVLFCVVLCCAVLCRAVLCCAVLCCVVLCCTVMCCAVLFFAVLCFAVLCFAVLCSAVLCALHCTVVSRPSKASKSADPGPGSLGLQSLALALDHWVSPDQDWPCLVCWGLKVLISVRHSLNQSIQEICGGDIKDAFRSNLELVFSVHISVF